MINNTTNIFKKIIKRHLVFHLNLNVSTTKKVLTWKSSYSIGYIVEAGAKQQHVENKKKLIKKKEERNECDKITSLYNETEGIIHSIYRNNIIYNRKLYLNLMINFPSFAHTHTDLVCI